MPGPPGPAAGRPEDKLDPGIHRAEARNVDLKSESAPTVDRRVKPGDDNPQIDFGV
jgi:hypothetical protein